MRGKKYIAHLRDLEFKRKGKLYDADMSDWITHATTQERLYTKNEFFRAQKAQEIIKLSGYVSEKEAKHFVNDGKIKGMPITSKDVQHAIDIYCRSAAAVRGKTTRKKTTTRDDVDDALKEQRTDQWM